MMPEKEGYEVIRFVERGKSCYISTDYVRGTTLYNWIQENRIIEKERLQKWIQEIVKQLVLFHKQQGKPSYNLLNPYNIIITRKNKIVFASTESAGKTSNQFIEKYFTPVNKNQNGDMYCFGKTIQFIMAHIQCEPCLTKQEEYKLLKIVRKCLEANPESQYENIQMIQNRFTKIKGGKAEHFKFKINKKAVIILVLIVLGVMGEFVWQRWNKPSVQLVKEEKKEEGTVEKVDGSQYFDIGLSYFLELEDYEKSKGCFVKAGNAEEKAGYYAELSRFMLDASLDKDVEKVLKALETKIKQEEEQDVREILILIRVYVLLDTKEAYREIVELSEYIKRQGQWDSLTENLQREFYQHQALAYEKSELWKQAIATYNVLAALEEGEKEREQVCLKLMEIYTRYVDSLWADQSLDETARLTEIRRIVAEKPELAGDESFINLIRTKGMQIEGERIEIEKAQ